MNSLSADQLPGDNATLDEWIPFVRETYVDAPFVAGHLETLAERDGRDCRMGFPTKDFLIYLDGCYPGSSAIAPSARRWQKRTGPPPRYHASMPVQELRWARSS